MAAAAKNPFVSSLRPPPRPMNRLLCLSPLIASAALAMPADPVAYRVEAKLADVVAPLEPSCVHLGGWLGRRIDINESNRLLVVDTKPLLAGFRQKPGEQAWIGEHMGKWLHAATLAWAYERDWRVEGSFARSIPLIPLLELHCF